MIHLHRPNQAYLEEANPGILLHIGTKKKILDIGCGSGALGEAMRDLGNEVVGVERHPDAVVRARSRLNRIVEADVTDFPKVQANLGNASFDALVFSDVLEHLEDPLAVLDAYLPLLRPGGTLLVSVPNVVAWDNRLRILLGLFDYSDTGIMDRTHLRFFTIKTAIQLVRATGLKIKTIDCTPQIVRAFLPLIKSLLFSAPPQGTSPNPREIADSPYFKFYEKFVYPIELRLARLWKGALAFRIIAVAKKTAPSRLNP